MFDIGASLAAARESRGLSLADAERLTCVRAKYLAALEHDDFDALPGRTYARAFLRTYASALGLEADKLVAEFEAVIPEPVEEPFLVATPRRRPRIGLRHVLGALAVAVAAIVVTVAATSRTATKSPPPASIVRPHPSTAKVLGAAHVQPAKVVHRVPQTLVIRAARGDCWVLVRRGGPTGATVYEGTLHQGGTLRFGKAKLWLRLGAPSSVDVTRGGTPVPGASGGTPVNLSVG